MNGHVHGEKSLSALSKLQQMGKFSAKTANAIITTWLVVLGHDQFLLSDTDSDMKRVGRRADIKTEMISKSQSITTSYTSVVDITPEK